MTECVALSEPHDAGWRGGPYLRLVPPVSVDGGSGQVEPVEVHDLAPGGNEVADELLLRVAARVDLSDRPELGVGTEDQVETAAGPLQLACPPVTALEGVLGLGGRLPHRAYVEQVHEEVVGQRPWLAGEHAEPG